jgi:hypothetical protein
MTLGGLIIRASQTAQFLVPSTVDADIGRLSAASHGGDEFHFLPNLFQPLSLKTSSSRPAHSFFMGSWLTRKRLALEAPS